jgi:hypothetical protein
MNNTEIQEIRSLLNNISQGPWMATNRTNVNNSHNWVVECGALNDVHPIAFCNPATSKLQETNAKFIASCRQNVPKMLDEIERLKETIRHIQHGMPIAGE